MTSKLQTFFQYPQFCLFSLSFFLLFPPLPRMESSEEHKSQLTTVGSWYQNPWIIQSMGGGHQPCLGGRHGWPLQASKGLLQAFERHFQFSLLDASGRYSLALLAWVGICTWSNMQVPNSLIRSIDLYFDTIYNNICI